VPIPSPGGQPWDPRLYSPPQSRSGEQGVINAWDVMNLVLLVVVPAAWTDVVHTYF
jgi:hypothetical protein